MKKIIIIHAITCMSATLYVQKASCQTFKDLIVLNMRMVETGQPSAIPLISEKDYLNDISTKAVREFLKNFKHAQNVSWRKAIDGGCIARFSIDSIQTTVAYNSKGLFSYSLKKYAENKMPRDLRNIIKRIYFDYNIIEVNEIEPPQQRESIIYSVLIKYADNFKILRICNKEIEIAGDYTKP